jgi:hypothetical protein
MIRAALLLALLSGVACRATGACKPGTVLLDVDLGPSGAAADELVVRATAAGSELAAGTLAHTPGQRRGTVEVRFAGGYPVGTAVALEVSARSQGTLLARGSTVETLAAGCAAYFLELPAGAGAGGDGPRAEDARDGGRPADILGADGALPDGALDGAADTPAGLDADTGCSGACAPGTTMACGRCGKRTCTSACTWGACSGERD